MRAEREAGIEIGRRHDEQRESGGHPPEAGDPGVSVMKLDRSGGAWEPSQRRAWEGFILSFSGG